MSSLRAAVVLLRILAAVLALLVARKRPDHKPVAIFLGVVVLGSLVHLAIEAWAIVPMTPSPTPLEGLPRVVAHVKQAIHLLWPFGVVALVGRVFLERGLRFVTLSYVVALVALIVGYPTLRGPILAKTYTGLELGSLLVSVGFALQWWQRRLSPTAAQVAAGLVLTLELVTLLGPYRAALFGGWERALSVYAVLYATLAMFQGVVLWTLSTSGRR